MNSREQKWIEHQRLEESKYRIEPPEGLWEDIERDLAKVIPSKSPQSPNTVTAKTPIALWKRYVAIAASIVAVITISLLLIFSPSIQTPSPSPISACIDNSTPHKIVASQLISKNISINTQNAILCLNSDSHYDIKPSSASLPADTASLITAVEIEFSQELDAKEENTDTSTPIVDTEETPTKKKKSSFYSDYYNLPVPNKKDAHSSRFSLGVFTHTSGAGNASYLATFTSGGITGNPSLPKPPSLWGTGGGKPSPDEESKNEITNSNSSQTQSKEVSVNERHNIPLKFGLSLNYNLSNRFSVESGIQYTILNSEITQTEDNSTINFDQTLHYLGIPLKLNVNIWNYKRLNLYAGVGAVIEKCVAGEVKFKDPKTQIIESKKLMENPLQLSAMANGGIQLNLLSNLGIFFEPGIAYYFNNHSEINNVYKAKKLTHDIKFGLRLNL